jgi:protein-S-isoprenylcysteine O-methyltransferase Ste14
MKLRIVDQQTFITTGPYQRIRHPMYTAFYMLHIATLLMLANWFIGVTWLVGLTMIITSRVRREEEMLVKRFGQQYINYQKNTGRFIPSINLVKYLSRSRE